jgi:hypothetical protein
MLRRVAEEHGARRSPSVLRRPSCPVVPLSPRCRRHRCLSERLGPAAVLGPHRAKGLSTAVFAERAILPNMRAKGAPWT